MFFLQVFTCSYDAGAICYTHLQGTDKKNQLQNLQYTTYAHIAHVHLECTF